MNFEKETHNFEIEVITSDSCRCGGEEFTEDPYQFGLEGPDDTDFDMIPLNTPVVEAVGEMRSILATAFEEGEPIIFYSSDISKYNGNILLFNNITIQWNEEVTRVSKLGEECFTQLKIQREEVGTYKLWIETIINGSISDVDPTWTLNSPEEVAEALRIFYYTGFVYTCTMATILV